MQKSKIFFLAVVTTIIVGVINSSSALIAYMLLVPEADETTQTLVSDNSDLPVIALPEPNQIAVEGSSGSNATQTGTSVSNTGETVQFRGQSDALVAGEKPQPTAISTKPDGSKEYVWCSGINSELPDDVCEAIISIASNPVASNPHLGTKARESLSLLPANSTIVMDERSWVSTGSDSGTMYINASTPEYGNVKLKIFLQKQNNIWVLVDGQLA